MKFYLFLFLLINSLCFCQSYNFTKRKKCIKYTDSKNIEKLKCENESIGNYKFVYERNLNGEAYITLYKDDKEVSWAAEIKKLGNQETFGHIYSKALYYDGNSKTPIDIYISLDKQGLIMHFEDDDILIFHK